MAVMTTPGLVRIALLPLIPLAGTAHVSLPAIFSDHLVLQRDRPVPVWGWVDPGEKISVIKHTDGGLVAKNGPLEGFVIAGADRQCSRSRLAECASEYSPGQVRLNGEQP